MIIGSVLARFNELELSTADDKRFKLKNNALSRLALRMIGLPHLGFRKRAGIILGEALKNKKSGMKALDAGCGYGLYSLTLADKGFDAIDSVDIDAGRVNELQALIGEQPELAARISPKVGSLTQLPFADKTYDLIICSEVIEHIADDSAAVRELGRVLKPGGTLLLSVPHDSAFNRRTYRRFDHQRPGYSKEMLARMFEPLGITIEMDAYYEFGPGVKLFNAFNAISSKPLMGILFYPMYALYQLDSMLRIGEPSYIIVRARKSLSA